jgi:hypothetical protein
MSRCSFGGKKFTEVPSQRTKQLSNLPLLLSLFLSQHPSLSPLLPLPITSASTIIGSPTTPLHCCVPTLPVDLGLAGNVGICVCRLHHPNDRHFCLLPTCRECWPDTLATFCYVGQYFGCQCRVGEFCCRYIFLYVSRNQY